MYTLSRILPDGTERPVVSGPPGRAGGEDEPAGCEFLPGETVRVGWLPAGHEEGIASTEIARFELTEIGVLIFYPCKRDCTPGLTVHPYGSGEARLTLYDGDRQVATMRYLEDVRVFIQVFPFASHKTPAPVA